MNNLIHSFTDALALASIAMGTSQPDPLRNSTANDNALFNVWVTDENAIRTLVRENVSAQVSGALVTSGNHGAKIQGLSRTYEAVPVDRSY